MYIHTYVQPTSQNLPVETSQFCSLQMIRKPVDVVSKSGWSSVELQSPCSVDLGDLGPFGVGHPLVASVLKAPRHSHWPHTSRPAPFQLSLVAHQWLVPCGPRDWANTVSSNPRVVLLWWRLHLSPSCGTCAAERESRVAPLSFPLDCLFYFLGFSGVKMVLLVCVRA